MRVVFTGISGLGKENIARAVAIEAAKQRGVPANLDDPLTKKYIQVLSVEDEIKKKILHLRPFLDHIDREERLRQWRVAFKEILQRASESEHSILCFHNVYYRNSDFSSCVDWDLLCAYHPTIFMTLINDVFDIWETINARERELASNSYFHLTEILAWRSNEISATDILAENLYIKSQHHNIAPDRLKLLQSNFPDVSPIFGSSIPHFIFSVKHPLKTLYQLLFRRDLLRIYASYPISDTRGLLEGRTEIDNFRQQMFLSNFLTVLDPLTIDEYRFPKSVPTSPPFLNPRWPLTFGPSIVNEVLLTENPFSGYSLLQYESFKTSIEKHIKSRDFKMVWQGETLVAYRPYYGGPLGSGAPPSNKPTQGVDKELIYAANALKLTYVVHPQQDRENMPPQIFAGINFAVAPDTTKKVLSQLEKVQKDTITRISRHGEKITWEN